MALGFACGMINGLLVIYVNIPHFMETLGMMSIARGAALWYTDGRPISGFEDSFRFLAHGDIFYIPVPVLIMFVVYSLAHFVMLCKTMGRYNYDIGGQDIEECL